MSETFSWWVIREAKGSVYRYPIELKHQGKGIVKLLENEISLYIDDLNHYTIISFETEHPDYRKVRKLEMERSLLPPFKINCAFSFMLKNEGAKP